MKTNFPIYIALVLGVILCASALIFLGRPGKYDLPDSPFALAESPYGQTLARLAKNKINQLHHGGQEHHHDEHEHHEGPAPGQPLLAKRRLGSGAPHRNAAPAVASVSWTSDWIDQMLDAKVKRTNPNPITPVHLKYLNRELGRKFAAAYAMDPTDYSIYNSYFVYLKDNPWVADRRKAGELALQTLTSCGRHSEGPGPALTGASAALDLAFIAIEDSRRAAAGFGASVPPQVCDVLLRLAGKNLIDYNTLREQGLDAGSWQRLSGERRSELDSYADFLGRQYRDVKTWSERQAPLKKSPNNSTKSTPNS